MSLYIFYASLNYASSLPNASIVNAQFIFQFISKSLTYRPHETIKKSKNAQNSSDADYSQKNITMNVVACQDGAVQFSDKI